MFISHLLKGVLVSLSIIGTSLCLPDTPRAEPLDADSVTEEEGDRLVGDGDHDQPAEGASTGEGLQRSVTPRVDHRREP